MLSEYIREVVKRKGIALMGHIVCGYPSFDANWQILEELNKAGVDIVEMQFPFSEPIADGPLFLSANQESLKRGTKTGNCFEFMSKASRNFSYKILMMGYYNTVFKTGEEKFCNKLADAGSSGLIIPDLPLEESHFLQKCCASNGQALIRLAAPTNTEERIKKILHGAEGFVYAVARKGVTGAKTNFLQDLPRYLSMLKSNSKVPLAVGFGISGKSDIDYLRDKADVAVMGTAILKSYMAQGREGVAELLKTLRI